MGFQVCKTKAVLCGRVVDSQGSAEQWGRVPLHWWACPVHSDCLGSLYRRWCVWKDHTSAWATPATQTHTYKVTNRKSKKIYIYIFITNLKNRKDRRKSIHTTLHQHSAECGAVSTPGCYPTHCLLSITFILCSSSSQSKPLIHWVYMEIHGNAFTVWSVWGTEYQSSVGSGDRPFRLRYLKDRNRALRPHRPAERQHHKGSGLWGCTVSYQRWRSTSERNG